MLWLVAVMVVGVEPDDKWLRDAAATTVSVARENLADATKQLAVAKKARVNPRAFGVNKRGQVIYRDAEDKKRAITRAEQEIEQCTALLKGTGDPLPLPARAPREGDFGIHNGFVVVIQVISDDAAIVRVITEYYGVEPYLAWIDCDTRNWVDDKKYALGSPVYVAGTKTYDAVIGTKTVRHLRMLTPDEQQRFHDLVKELAAQDEPTKKPNTAPKR